MLSEHQLLLSQHGKHFSYEENFTLILNPARKHSYEWSETGGHHICSAMNKLFSLSFLEQVQKQLTNTAQASIWKAISCIHKADELYLPLGFYWKRASDFS